MYLPEELDEWVIKNPVGISLDHLDLETDLYEVSSELLRTEEGMVSETVFTHLFKSNCLATGQPDWATVTIRYHGPRISHESLLKYLISYRNHQGFHEHWCWSVFFMIFSKSAFRYNYQFMQGIRAGEGLDINPFRSNYENEPRNDRLARQ